MPFALYNAFATEAIEEYDFVIYSMKKMTLAQLLEKTKLFNQFEMTKGMVYAKLFEFHTDHRGQNTVYLLLAKVKPPNEKLF